MLERDAYELEPGEKVCCYVCMESRDFTQYGRGEAVLAGAWHYPYNAEANFICKEHLDKDAVIYDPQTFKR